MPKLVLLPTILLLCCHELCALPSAPSNGGKVQIHDISPGEIAPARRQTRQANACGCVADVYESANYRGRVLKIFQQNAEFRNDAFEDIVDSIRLHGNCRWLFYEHPNFVGDSHLLRAGYYASAPTWGGRGNRISAARALPPNGTPAIALFEHRYYTGRMLVLYGSNTQFNSLHFDNSVSSVIVIGGVWTLYEHPYYQGRSTILHPGEYANIRGYHVGEDRVSSLRKIS